MLKLQKSVPASHANLLIERYERLRAWALQLSEHDVDKAQDLLQEFFIHFTVRHPDLNSIKDLDGYLFVVMRNLHLSQVRSATRNSQRVLSVVEFDSAEVGFWVADPRDRIRMHDELRAVCQYACLRKETSKAGSVLILRFFHGYYPSEIARLLCVKRPAVSERLKLARAEARVYLDDPDRLAFIQENPNASIAKLDLDWTADDLSNEFRAAIFNSRCGDCLSHEQFQDIYKAKNSVGPECKTLAHIVSCSNCLDAVNELLGLPLLADRYSDDSINKDTNKKGGPGGIAPGGPGKTFVKKYLCRAKQIFEHEPRELCVSVNGYLQGSQKISSERSELSLVVDSSEAIGFVEVFSEQGVRLLFLNVDPLPVGAVRQSERVELSEGRTIDASLSFSTSWPTIQVVYNDPTLSSELVAETEEDGATGRVGDGETDYPIAPLQHHPIAVSPRFLLRYLSNWTFWLRPGVATAVLAALLFTAILFLVRHRVNVPTPAREVLLQAQASERAQAAQADQVVHRTLYLEEWSGSALQKRQRIELWQKGATEIAARRVYDTEGQLQNGEWRRPDGTHLLFNHGAKLRSAPSVDSGTTASVADVWRLTPSAQEFNALMSAHGDASAVRMEERENSLVLSFADNTSSSQLVQARLVLNRADLHAIGLTLVMRVVDTNESLANRQSAIGNRQLKEYRFTEAAYKREAVGDVAPSVFEPDPALLSGATKVSAPLEPSKTPEPNATSSPAGALVASLDLEVEVLRALNQVNALSGEQVSLTRTPAGSLRVQGIVDTEERKAEIFRSLAPVKTPAVVVEIQTAAAAAAAAQQKQSSGPTQSITVESVAVDRTQMLPVASELQRYFTQKGIAQDQIDSEMQRVATQTVARARVMRRDALALKQVATRFSGIQLQQLDATKRAEWNEMLRARARSVAHEASLLLQGLEPMFPGFKSAVRLDMKLDDEAEIARAAEKLFELAAECDRGINQSFSIYSSGAQPPAVKSNQFWQSLSSTQMLAEKIARM